MKNFIELFILWYTNSILLYNKIVYNYSYIYTEAPSALLIRFYEKYYRIILTKV